MLRLTFRISVGMAFLFPLSMGACTGSIGGDIPDGISDDVPVDDPTTPIDESKVDNPPSAGGPCRIAVPLRRLTELQYRNAVRDVFKQQVALPSDFAIPTLGSPASGFSTDPEYNAVDLGVARRLHDSATSLPLAVVDKLPGLLPCASSPNDTCASTFIDTYGRKAYRRPLTAPEKATLTKAFKLGTGADAFKDGIAAVVAVMLDSPQFLYQTEIGEADDSGAAKLGGYEIASRLSLLLWDSVPDDALLEAAGSGVLDAPKGIRTQVDRMLADPKARDTVVRFAREWIHLPRPAVGQRTDKAYTEALATAIQGEFDRFIGDAFLNDNAPLETFLSSPEPYKNATLDAFIKANGGYNGRSGLLTQPAVLTGLAGASDTSPIRRAVFVRTKVTCEEFPAPPADANAVDSELPLPANATQQDRAAARSKDSRCAGCHSLIDPLGFGFESFDELGRFRQTSKDGSRIDPTGDFVEPVDKNLAGKFSSLPELGKRLSGSPAVAECLGRQYFRFNYGRMDGDADACSIHGIADRFKDSGLGLRDLIVSVTTADEFRFRSGQ